MNELPEYPERFAAALVSEIKAEMGRRGLSSRKLGRTIGKSSQYMSDRLDGGSPKTKRRTPLNVRDLAAIASSFGLTADELAHRATVALGPLPDISRGAAFEADREHSQPPALPDDPESQG